MQSIKEWKLEMAERDKKEAAEKARKLAITGDCKKWYCSGNYCNACPFASVKDFTCPHNLVEVGHGGRCITNYKCSKCGIKVTVDSSD